MRRPLGAYLVLHLFGERNLRYEEKNEICLPRMWIRIRQMDGKMPRMPSVEYDGGRNGAGETGGERGVCSLFS